MEATFTIRPYFWRSIKGTTARQHKNTPIKSTSIICFQTSTGYSQLFRSGPEIPALATRISIFPNFSAVAAAALPTLPASVTSAVTPSTVPPPPRSFTADVSNSPSRSQSVTEELLTSAVKDLGGGG